jgi:hypothetical protein
MKGKSTSEASGEAAIAAFCQIYYPIIRSKSMKNGPVLKNDEIFESMVPPPRAR